MVRYAKPFKKWIQKRSKAGRRLVHERSPEWLVRTMGPTAKYLDMLLFDHGVFRLVYLNRHRLGASAWRSAQPAPHDLAWFQRAGVKTIVNLRGPRLCGSYWLEEAHCRRLGLELVNYVVRSRAAPTLKELEGAKELFERISYPMAMHCKSGADRAGLMSVLYMHFVEGQPIEQAMRQLSLRYGHIRQADTGIIDHFFEDYIAYNRRRPIAFWTWVQTVYDPAAVHASFKASGLATRFVGGVLRRE